MRLWHHPSRRTVFFGPPLAFQLEFRPIISLRGETVREKIGVQHGSV